MQRVSSESRLSRRCDRRPLPHTGRAASAVVVAALAAAGCGVETDVETDSVTEAVTEGTIDQQAVHRVFEEACSVAGRRALALSGSCRILSVSRTDLALGNHIVEYNATVQVGPDAVHEIIGLHRVVKELAPWTPIITFDSLMMVHGDAWSFDSAFRDSPESGAAPIFLAQHNVDVWGIDLRWTQVSPETKDFTFMKDWGLDTDGQDLGMALSIARAVRYYTGSGFSKMLLLGWSRGGQTGYTYLSTETTRPASQRHVRGFIPVETFVKFGPNDSRQADACARIHDPVQGNLAPYEAGVYASNQTGLLATLGELAASQPDGLSPFSLQGQPFFGYVNKQVALAAGEATFQFLFKPFAPHYHFTGGRFDDNGVPTGLSYVADEQRWFRTLQLAGPFEPLKLLLDSDAMTCNDGSSNLDAHLAQITVPVFYIGAGGGIGAAGLHTLTLLGSRDTRSLIQSVTPGDDLHDLGHFDIWLSQHAQHLWWQPILHWIQEQRTY